MGKHEDHFKKTRLKENEEIIKTMDGYIGRMFGKGKDEQFNGELILSNERIVFMCKTWLREVYRSIPIVQVSSIDYSAGLMAKTITFVSNNDTIEFTSLGDKEQLNELHNLAEEMRGQTTQDKTSQSPKTDDIPGQIKKLSELKDAGILTESEFENKKKELLNKM